MKSVCVLVALAAVSLAAADAPKDSAPPAPVSEEVMRFLGVMLNLRVTDMDPATALEWQLRLADIPLTVEATEKAGAKKVTFDLVDVTLAEALRTVSKNTGAQYRIVGKAIRLAMPEEWKEIDAGKKRFEEFRKKEAAAK